MFNVDLPCRVKSAQLGIISNKQSGGAIVRPQPSSCSYICQHCLVHLGDIGEPGPDLSPLTRPRHVSPVPLSFSTLPQPDEPGRVVLQTRGPAGPVQR